MMVRVFQRLIGVIESKNVQTAMTKKDAVSRQAHFFHIENISSTVNLSIRYQSYCGPIF